MAESLVLSEDEKEHSWGQTYSTCQADLSVMLGGKASHRLGSTSRRDAPNTMSPPGEAWHQGSNNCFRAVKTALKQSQQHRNRS